MSSAILSSKSNSYIVDSLLGEGGFGTVRKCIRKEDMKTVAIKIQKLNRCNLKQITRETSSLLKLRELDPDKCSIVRFYEAFVNDRHVYLVFEELQRSLHDFINERQSNHLLLKEIRPIVCQLANAFNHLSTLGLIHTDLKMDNVMLVNHIQEPYRVKLIDFGLAIDVSAAKAGSTVQPTAYRSPEILLGLPFTEAIDMWSLGIMTATMFLGKHLFSSMTDYDAIRNIVETLGQPPDYMLCHGLKTHQYFKRDKKSASLWRLKTPKEYKEEIGITLNVTRRRALRSLDDLVHIHPINHENCVDNIAEMRDRVIFLDMLKRMLQVDPKERITPRQVLCHPFISGSHLIALQPFSPHVESCYDIMRAYQCCLDDDVREVVHGSLEEPTSGLAHPVQSGGLPDVNSGLSLCIIESQYPSTLNKSAGIKRKVIHDDGTVDETPRVSKRIRSECQGGGCGDPATASRSHDPTDHVQANAAVRSNPTQHHSVNTTFHQQQTEQRCIRAGIKRKFTDDENDQIAKRFRQSNAAPSTLCRSSRTQTFVPPGVKPSHEDNPDPEKKRALDDNSGHVRKRAHDEESLYKRKRALDDDPGHERKKRALDDDPSHKRKRALDEELSYKKKRSHEDDSGHERKKRALDDDLGHERKTKRRK